MELSPEARFNQQETIRSLFKMSSITIVYAGFAGIVDFYTNNIIVHIARLTFIAITGLQLLIAFIWEFNLKKGKNNG